MKILKIFNSHLMKNNFQSAKFEPNHFFQLTVSNDFSIFALDTWFNRLFITKNKTKKIQYK